MKSVTKLVVAALAIAGALALGMDWFGMRFGHSSYWSAHGVLFLVFITLFPRLTLLFSDVATGGLFWWLGWVFAPRVLVAVLATFAYWHQNPLLVGIAWLVALGGESSEKYVVVRRGGARWRHRSGGGLGQSDFERAKWVKSE